MDAGTVNLILELDLSKANAQLANFKKQLTGMKLEMPVTAIGNFDIQYKKLNTNTIRPKVDHSELTALNKHLDLKVSHYKKVQDIFNKKPLRIKFVEEKVSSNTEDTNKTLTKQTKTNQIVIVKENTQEIKSLSQLEKSINRFANNYSKTTKETNNTLLRIATINNKGNNDSNKNLKEINKSTQANKPSLVQQIIATSTGNNLSTISDSFFVGVKKGIEKNFNFDFDVVGEQFTNVSIAFSKGATNILKQAYNLMDGIKGLENVKPYLDAIPEMIQEAVESITDTFAAEIKNALKVFEEIDLSKYNKILETASKANKKVKEEKITGTGTATERTKNVAKEIKKLNKEISEALVNTANIQSEYNKIKKVFQAEIQQAEKLKASIATKAVQDIEKVGGKETEAGQEIAIDAGVRIEDIEKAIEQEKKEIELKINVLLNDKIEQDTKIQAKQGELKPLIQLLSQQKNNAFKSNDFQNILSVLFKGKNVSPDLLPQVDARKMPKGQNAAYSPSLNSVFVPPEVFVKLSRNLELTEREITDIIHELGHAINSAFGTFDKNIMSPLDLEPESESEKEYMNSFRASYSATAKVNTSEGFVPLRKEETSAELNAQRQKGKVTSLREAQKFEKSVDKQTQLIQQQVNTIIAVMQELNAFNFEATDKGVDTFDETVKNIQSMIVSQVKSIHATQRQLQEFMAVLSFDDLTPDELIKNISVLKKLQAHLGKQQQELMGLGRKAVDLGKAIKDSQPIIPDPWSDSEGKQETKQTSSAEIKRPVEKVTEKVAEKVVEKVAEKDEKKQELSKATNRIRKEDFANLKTALETLTQSIEVLTMALNDSPEATATATMAVPEETAQASSALSVIESTSSAFTTVNKNLHSFGQIVQKTGRFLTSGISPFYKTLATVESAVMPLIPYGQAIKSLTQTLAIPVIGGVALNALPGGMGANVIHAAQSGAGMITGMGAQALTGAFTEAIASLPFVGPSLATAGGAMITGGAEALAGAGGLMLAAGGAGQIVKNVASYPFKTANKESFTPYPWEISQLNSGGNQPLLKPKKKGLLSSSSKMLQAVGENIGNQLKPATAVNTELLAATQEVTSSLALASANQNEDITKLLDSMLTTEGIRKLIQMSNTTLGTNIKASNKSKNLKALAQSGQSQEILKLAQGQLTDLKGNQLILPNASESGKTKYRKKGSEIKNSLPSINNFDLTEKYLKQSVIDFAKTLSQLTTKYNNTNIDDLYASIDSFVGGLRDFELQNSLTQKQSNKIQGIKSVAENLKTKVAQLSTYKPTELSNATEKGEFYIEGVSKGIKVALPELVLIVRDAGKQMDNAMKMALDERSPSKKGQQKGAWYIEGIIKGIKSTAKTLYETLKNVGKKIDDSVDPDLFGNKNKNTPQTPSDFDETTETTENETYEKATVDSSYYESLNDLKDFLNEIKDTRQEIKEVIDQATIISNENPDFELNDFLDDIRKTREEIANETQKANEIAGLDDLGNSPMFEKIGQGFEFMKTAVFRFLGTGLLLNTLSTVFNRLTDGAFEAALQVENLERSIAFSTAENGAMQLSKIKKEAQALGISYLQAAEGLRQFSASTMGTSLHEQSGELVGQFQKSFAAFGLDASQQEGAFLALSQMASKSVVSMEELRQQLGERLPGAMGAAARSMGMTIPEFNKLVESGQVLAEDLLPAMAQQLENETSLGLASTVESTQAEMNRLENSIFNLQAALGGIQLMLAKPSFQLLNTVLASLINNVDVLAISVGVFLVGSFMSFVTILKTTAITSLLLNKALLLVKTTATIMMGTLAPMIPWAIAAIAVTKALSQVWRTLTAGTAEIKEYTKALKELEATESNIRNKPTTTKPQKRYDRDFTKNPLGDENQSFSEVMDEAVDFATQRSARQATEFVNDSERINKSLESVSNSIIQAHQKTRDITIGGGVIVSNDLSDDTVSKVQQQLDKLRAERANLKFGVAVASGEGDLKTAQELQKGIAKVNKEINQVSTEPFLEVAVIEKRLVALQSLIKTLDSKAEELDGKGLNSQANSIRMQSQEAKNQEVQLLAIIDKRNEALKETNNLYLKRIQTLRQLQRELAKINYTTALDSIDGQIAATNKRSTGQSSEYGFDTEMRKVREIEVKTKLTLSSQAFKTYEDDVTKMLNNMDATQKAQLGKQIGVDDLGVALMNKQISPESLTQLTGDKVPQEIKDLVEQSPDLKEFIDKGAEYLSTWQDIKQQQLESANIDKENADAQRQRASEIKDFSRQVEDLDLQIADYFRQRARGLEDFETQYQDIAIQNQRQSRDLLEQYQDLGRTLNTQLVQAKNQLAIITKEVQRQSLINDARQSLNFGADGLFSGFFTMVEEMMIAQEGLDNQSLTLNEQRLQVEEEVVNIARQVRSLQEQVFDMERQRINQLRDLMRAQEDWILQQTSSWLSITRQVADMETQAKQMGLAFTGIAEHLDGINGSYLQIHNAIAAMATQIQQSANELSVNSPTGGGSGVRTGNVVNPVAGLNMDSNSQWGASRDGGKRTHWKVDYPLKEGTPVVAPIDGTLKATAEDKGEVMYQLTSGSVVITLGHIKDAIVEVGKSITVSAGQQIGAVGGAKQNGGRGSFKSTGPHLDYGVQVNGNWIHPNRFHSEPMKYLGNAYTEIPMASANQVSRSGVKTKGKLTIDDGPNPKITNAILDELKATGQKATFYLVGAMVEAYPDVVKRIYKEGHTLGVHSYTHRNLSTLPRSEVDKELQLTKNAINSVIKGIDPSYKGVSLFRAPFGATNATVNSSAQSLGLSKSQGWDIDTEDWKRTTTKKNIQDDLKGARSGQVILLHDGNAIRDINNDSRLQLLIKKHFPNFNPIRQIHKDTAPNYKTLEALQGEPSVSTSVSKTSNNPIIAKATSVKKNDKNWTGTATTPQPKYLLSPGHSDEGTSLTGTRIEGAMNYALVQRVKELSASYGVIIESYLPPKQSYQKSWQLPVQKEAQGYTSIEIHHDAGTEPNYEGSTGVIPGIGGRGIEVTDEKLAKEYGAFPKGFRDLGAPKRGISILEVGVMTAELMKRYKEDQKFREQYIDEQARRLLEVLKTTQPQKKQNKKGPLSFNIPQEISVALSLDGMSDMGGILDYNKQNPLVIPAELDVKDKNLIAQNTQVTLVDLLKQAGFKENEIPIMVGIIAKESNFNSKALNDNPTTGDLSYGLAQINMIGKLGPARREQFGISRNEELYDPLTNLKAARKVFLEQGFQAWSVYKNGSYKDGMNQHPVINSNNSIPAVSTPIINALPAGSGDLKQIISGLKNGVLNPSITASALSFKDPTDYRSMDSTLQSQVSEIGITKQAITEQQAAKNAADQAKQKLENEKRMVAAGQELINTLYTQREQVYSLQLQMLQYNETSKGYLTASERSQIADMEKTAQLRALEKQLYDTELGLKKLFDFSGSPEQAMEALDTLVENSTVPELKARLSELAEEYKAGIVPLTEMTKQVELLAEQFPAIATNAQKAIKATIAFTEQIMRLDEVLNALRPLSDVFDKVDKSVGFELKKQISQLEADKMFLEQERTLNTEIKKISEELASPDITPQKSDMLKGYLTSLQSALGKLTNELKLEYNIRLGVELDYQQTTEQLQGIISSSNRAASQAEKYNPFDAVQYKRIAKELEIQLNLQNDLKAIEDSRRQYQGNLGMLTYLDQLESKLVEIASLDLGQIEQEVNVFAQGIKDPLNNAFKGLFSDFIKGTKSLKDIFMDFATSVADFFSNLAAKFATEWAMSKLFPTAQTSGGGGGFGSLFGGGSGNILGSLVGGIGSLFTGGTNFGLGVPGMLTSMFADGGTVDSANMSMSLMKAMQLEGTNAVPIVAHLGERLISYKNGDTKILDALERDGVWDFYKHNKNIKNFNAGGVVGNGIQQFSRNYTNNNRTQSMNTVINVTTPDSLSFRKSRSQLAQEEKIAQRRASKFN